MTGFGVQQEHGSYDEVADELATAARRLAAPLALAARKKAIDAQQETTRNKAQLAARRSQFARTTETQHQQRTLRNRNVAAARQTSAER